MTVYTKHVHVMFNQQTVSSLQCAVTLTRNVAAPAVALVWSSAIASSKMSASDAPTNVAFSPSPTHLFTALSSAWLLHKYSIGFVTGVLRNAKTKTASSGRFELDPSSSRPTFLCCLRVPLSSGVCFGLYCDIILLGEVPV